VDVSGVKKLRPLEEEDRRLKQMVDEQALDIPGAEGNHGKKLAAPSFRK
jgi:hypothetical protein